MKFLCPACERLSELSQFRFDAGALAIRCEKCGEEARVEGSLAAALPAAVPEAPAGKIVALRPVELPAQSPAADAFVAPPGHCPKCIAPRAPGAQACVQCGLVYVNHVHEVQAPALVSRWEQVLARWAEPAAHEAFLQACVVEGSLAAAGRLYRIQLALRPNDPYAARGREEVIRLATASTSLLGATAEVRRAEQRRWVQWLLIVAAIVMVGICLGLIRRALGP